jgi:hypothetical protein
MIYRGFMHEHVIRVTDEELTLLLAALRAFLSDFGHDEADVCRAIKSLIAKLPHVEPAG